MVATVSGEANVMDTDLFDKHSQAQATLHEMAGPMLRNAAAASARAAVANGDRAYGLLICGAMSGQNDLNAVALEVLPQVRAVAPDLPVRIVANDLVTNDWERLFKEFDSLRARKPAEMRGVTCSCAAGNFRHRLVEPECLHLVRHLTSRTL